MHPRGVTTLVLLGRFVRTLPIALGLPPQSGRARLRPAGGSAAVSDFRKSFRVIFGFFCFGIAGVAVN